MELTKRCIILSGEPLYREDFGGDFIVDFETLSFHKDTFIIDYDHLEDEILGVLSNVRIEDGQLVGDARIESVTEGDRASEVIARINSGTPYEMSPTLIIDSQSVEEVEIEGKTVKKYKNVEFRGVSIVPYGTDKNTKLLKLEGDKMKKTKKLEAPIEDVAVEEIIDQVEAVDETGEVVEAIEENPYSAVPELEEYISEYGLELGVELYRRYGLDKEGAAAYDYAQLKQCRKMAAEEDLTKEEVEAIATDAEVPPEVVEEVVAEVDGEKKEEKMSAILRKLSQVVAKQSKQIAALKAVKRGADPVSTGSAKTTDKRSAILRYADKIKNRK